MKYAVIVIVVIFIFAQMGCKSKVYEKTDYERVHEKAQVVDVQKTDSVVAESLHQTAKQSIEHTREKTTTTYYRADGTVQAVQTQRRQTGRAELDASNKREREVSVKEETTDIVSEEKVEQKATHTLDKKTETRGLLNLWWLPCGLLVLAVLVWYVVRFFK